MNLPFPFAVRIVRWSFETNIRWGRQSLAQTLGLPVELRPDGDGKHLRTEFVVAGIEK